MQVEVEEHHPQAPPATQLEQLVYEYEEHRAFAIEASRHARTITLNIVRLFEKPYKKQPESNQLITG